MTNNLEWVDEAWQKVQAKIDRTSKKIGANFPHASVNGTYQLEEPHWWTAGFWPGLLWLVYRESKDESIKQLAEQCEDRLDSVITDYYRLDHDMGFMWTLTSVARFKLLGEEDSKRRALLVANLLAGRFNTSGNYIRAWNPWQEGEDNSGWAIIDCLMNLPLLFWATEETGDPRFSAVAKKHGETVLKNFIREDGSVHHIIRFDPVTGERVEALGGQGFAPDSAWSRGASWAVYGLTLLFHHTKEDKYLQAAKNVSHFFIANLPEDYVPHWDFRLPEEVTKYRDSSAGAIASCGLLLLAKHVPATEEKIYKDAGVKILKSLYKNYGDWENPEQDGLILHGTSHYPEGKNIDVPLIYGDYYFVEGLAILKGDRKLFW
ncbi:MULTISPECIES: glycoside hydrolase family 88 protein [Metabacillus]|uniref:Glycosyl hydrolase n=2 Tax=Metabacillus TaxID=2675233 RepID=A0A179SMK8_9BACI|nr:MULTISPECIES: glycoside hydrolase family 88 protein [Metabacillus]OAS82578.1 glycosyl hydrolase [Metabacillus litoralis]QNF26764.1 glycoside hydrolase family 88 protein [Metabacillus sp. KUDC1714]